MPARIIEAELTVHGSEGTAVGTPPLPVPLNRFGADRPRRTDHPPAGAAACYSNRNVKCSTSRYHGRDNGRPALSTDIITIDIAVHWSGPVRCQWGGIHAGLMRW